MAKEASWGVPSFGSRAEVGQSPVQGVLEHMNSINFSFIVVVVQHLYM